MTTNAGSALVVLVPEAEPLVARFRDAFDPSAAAGVPAHITILYPFKAPGQIGEEDHLTLKALFARISALHFVLPSVGSFGKQVLFLQVEPASVFNELTASVCALYSEFAPYRGQHAELIPHLTFADRLPDADTFERVTREFAFASIDVLPITARADNIALLDNQSGRWMVRAVFPLGR